jgi:hypothetical protein
MWMFALFLFLSRYKLSVETNRSFEACVSEHQVTCIPEAIVVYSNP